MITQVNVYKMNSFYATFNSDITEKEKNFYINEINKENISKNNDGIITDFYKHNNDVFWKKVFIDNFDNKIKSVYQEFGYDTVYYGDIWFQRYGNGSKHDWHTHSATSFSTVFYLSLPDNSSPTTLIDPFSLDQIDVKIHEGDFCIFPAHIFHSVKNNNSKEERIVIVINTQVASKNNENLSKIFKEEK